MPSAFDRRRQSISDHDPLRGLLDYESVNETAQNAGNPIQAALTGILSLLGLGSVLQFVQSLLGIGGASPIDPSAVWSNIANVFIKPLGTFAELIGGLLSGSVIPLLDPTKILTLPGLFTNVLNGFAGIFNGIFGGGASTATTIEEAIAEAQTAVIVTVSPNNPAVVDLAGRVAVLENTAGGNTWFEGLDEATLTSRFTVLSGSVAVKNTSGVPDYIQSDTAAAAVLRYNAEQFLTAQQYAQMRMRSPESGRDALAIMADATGTTFVAVEVEDEAFTLTNNFIRIISSTSGVAGRTVRDEFELPGNWSANDVVGIGYSPDTDTYLAYLNDNPVCDWTDSGGVAIPTTGTNQLVLLNMSGGFSGNRGAGIDNVTGYDWT